MVSLCSLNTAGVLHSNGDVPQSLERNLQIENRLGGLRVSVGLLWPTTQLDLTQS